jgi:RHS repeat-associated protein
VADRTEDSTTFELPGGSLERRVYGAPVNYQDEGEWQPIEEGFEPAGSSFESSGHPFELRLPSRLGTAPVRFTSGDEWISFEQEGPDSVPAEAEGDGAVSYGLPGEGVEVGYATLPEGLKESIELAGPSSPSTFRYDLQTSAGLTPSLEADGSILFRTAAGDEVAEIPAPTVEEAGSPASAAGVASYFVTARPGGGWNLALEVQRSWLEEAGRSWPVTIDPSVLEKEGAVNEGCTIRSNAESSLCTLPTLTAGVEKVGGSLVTSRAPINFNVSSLRLPAGALIEEASVNLYSEGSAAGVGGVELRRLTKSWSAGRVTWACTSKDNHPCESPWTSPGGDFSNEGSQVLTNVRGGGPGWWKFSGGLVPIFQGASEGATLYGLILKLDNETEANGGGPVNRSVVWDSSRATEVAKRPYIGVRFLSTAPAAYELASPSDGTRTDRFLRLKAKWGEEGSVSGVTFQYKVGEGKGAYAPVPLGLIHKADGEPIKEWPMPVSGLETGNFYLDAAHLTPLLPKEGGQVFVRAVFNGTVGASGYSPPRETIVDRVTGSPDDATAEVGPGTLDLETGNLSIGHTDVSIPTFNSGLQFTRSFNSRTPRPITKTEKAEPPSVLGPGWKSGFAVEEAGTSEFRNVRMEILQGTEKQEVGENCRVVEYEEDEEEIEEEVCEPEIIEVPYRYAYAVVTANEGGELAFEETSANVFATPDELTGWTLTREGAEGTPFKLKDPEGDVTTFETVGGGSEYFPTSISQVGGSTNPVRVLWHFNTTNGQKQLVKLISAAAPGLTCTEVTVSTPIGCRALEFKYGATAGGERLTSIEYLAPGNGGATTVASYSYNAEGRLIKESDPRSGLVEEYSYGTNGELQTLTPPGQKPWTLEYQTVEEETGVGRLRAVKRSSLLASPTVAQTTVAYGVPLTGGPYEMGAKEVGQWGQTDAPTDATAIFPPSQVPANPPASFSQATVYYLDSEGNAVNVATPKGRGTSAASISTAEADEYGNIIRELSPDNRLAVLAKPTAEREATWKALETRRRYIAEGTQLNQEWGPMHPIRLAESGETVEAQVHRTFEYNDPAEISPSPHLPTRETVGASNPKWGADKEVSETETQYNWHWLEPTKTITVMGLHEPNIESVTVYDETTGLPIETRQPSNAAGGGAGTTRTTYYSGPHEEISQCDSTRYAGLPCKVAPAKQPGTAGQPELLVTKYLAYDGLDEPTSISESPGGGTANVRSTAITYDAAGRRRTTKVTGGGTETPETETVYSPTTGQPTKEQFVCEPACKSEATTTTYDALGRLEKYEDADGNTTTTTYDLDGRPATSKDAKGTQTFHYDETSGLLTGLEVSGIGTLTAGYDADGNLTERGLPNGLTARTTYNSSDEPMSLAYTKTSSCGENCTWYQEALERSIYGQIETDNGTLAKDRYTYDKDGRLTETQETPTEGQCTTRAYSFDADSNRLSKTVRPGLGGACAISGGATQTYKYDGADRLEGPTYDAWGRITNLPAEYAGGTKPLTTSYFSSNMVSTQSQAGVTNTFQVDASGRQRQREQAGGVAGTEIFHYDTPGDSSSWSALGSTWSRDISGIGGELAAVQESIGTATFKLTDLHGDVVASASSSPTVTKLLGTYRFSEFGEPLSESSSGRFGWLGGKARRTELASGVVQMGARSYVPALGRFLTPDPIPGGSANPYDYANQDPVNGFDLEGTCSTKKSCKEMVKRRAAKARRVTARFVRAAKAALAKGAAKDGQRMVPFIGVSFHVPSLEHLVEQGEEVLSLGIGVQNHTCERDSFINGWVGGALMQAPSLLDPEATLTRLAVRAGQAIFALAGGQIAASTANAC